MFFRSNFLKNRTAEVVFLKKELVFCLFFFSFMKSQYRRWISSATCEKKTAKCEKKTAILKMTCEKKTAKTLRKCEKK